jgi:hypothetical protein
VGLLSNGGVDGGAVACEASAVTAHDSSHQGSDPEPAKQMPPQATWAFMGRVFEELKKRGEALGVGRGLQAVVSLAHQPSVALDLA